MEPQTKIQAFQSKNKFWAKAFYITIAILVIDFLLIKFREYGVSFPFPVGNFNILIIFFTIFTGIYFIKYLISWKKDPDFQDIMKSNSTPVWLNWSFSFFPWLAIYIIFRLFIYEPFAIPSGSMLPTLNVGTLVIVDKNDKVLLNPINQEQIMQRNKFERGEVAVFRFPYDPQITYIKRIVGVPGDTIVWDWKNENLNINGQDIVKKQIDDLNAEVVMPVSEGKEIKHSIQTRAKDEPLTLPGEDTWKNVTGFSHCQNTEEKLTCQIPEGFYFVMGDNRNNSADSRFWGLLDHKYMIGKAEAQLDVWKLKAGKL